MDIIKSYIGKRLMLGFAAVLLVILVSVGFSVVAVSRITDINQRIVHLRNPAYINSADISAEVTANVAAIRGYMLTGNPALKTERVASWTDIAGLQATLDRLAPQLSSAEDRQRWERARGGLNVLRTAQDKIEALAHTPDAEPATKLFNETMAPRAAEMIAALTAMIETEQTLDATAERKQLLKLLADARSAIPAITASVRSFLIKPDAALKSQAETTAASLTQLETRLAALQPLFNPAQQDSYQAYLKARDAFAPLPGKAIAIRESPEWNAPFTILTREAIPASTAILDSLQGRRGPDSRLTGGLKESQFTLLGEDLRTIESELAMLSTIEVILLVLGLLVAAGATWLTARAVVTPVLGMTAAMRTLATGDKSVDVPALAHKGEIGGMARSIQVFKDTAIEAERLAQQEKQDQLARETRAKLIEDLTRSFESAAASSIQSLSKAAQAMESSSGDMADTAAKTNRQATNVAEASEQTAQNVSSVAAATEELSSSVSEIKRQVEQSAHKAGNAHEQVVQTNDTVNGLAEAAKRTRRGGESHQRDRRPDQSAGAQRDDRGGAGRRSGQGIRRRGQRGEKSRQPDRPRDRGNLLAGCGHPVGHGGSRRRHAGRGSYDQRDQRHRRADLGLGRTAVQRDRRDRAQHRAGRRRRIGGRDQHLRRELGNLANRQRGESSAVDRQDGRR
ncbi:MAG: MCP four helix bundle domain-containing protein, partial [Pseudomonadota bacterium]